MRPEREGIDSGSLRWGLGPCPAKWRRFRLNIVTLSTFESNFAHSEGYPRAYRVTNRGFIALEDGSAMLRAEIGSGLFRGRDVRDVAPPGGCEMVQWAKKALRNPNARITGVVYLLYFLTAIFAEFLLGRNLVTYGTAANLIATAFYMVLTLLFYGMFKPVNSSLSLLAAIFSLAGCAVMTLGYFPRASLPFSPLLFFGLYCLLIGYLVYRSSFLPTILGVLMVFAGLGWLAILVPAIANNLSLYIEVLGIVAEGSLMLWLVVMGVNIGRWNELANAAARPPSIASAVRVRG